MTHLVGFASVSQYPSLDVRPGDVVANNYRVEAILSRERGMLLEARHTEFDQRVAVRLLTPVSCTDRDVEGFRREIRTLAKLESEHVARILDVGEHHDGSMFLVREHVMGSTLADAVVPGPMTLPRAVDIILELGEAVQEAHSHGVVLRDLRPEHVMLATRRGGESRAKLVDFGTAKLIGEQAGPEATMVLTGSPYASPELVRSLKDIDTRTDVWSLGCLFYLLLTGRAPFEGNGPQLMLAIAKGNPTPISQLRPDLPRELDQVIGWALAKDRDRRFSTVYAFAHALRPFASTAGAVLVDRIGRLAEIAKTVDPEALAMQESAARPARRLSRRGASEPPPSHAGYDARPSTPSSMPPPSMPRSRPSHVPAQGMTQPPPPPWSYDEPSFEAGPRSSYPPAYDDMPGATPSIPAVAASLPAQAPPEPKRLGAGMLAALCLALVIAPAATIGLMFQARGGVAPAAAAQVDAPASIDAVEAKQTPAARAPPSRSARRLCSAAFASPPGVGAAHRTARTTAT